MGGGQDVRTPLKNHKNIGFLSNTGPDLLKITKLQRQHSKNDHYRHANETQFKWRFTGGPMMARLKRYFDPPFHHQLKTTTTKRNIVKVGPPLTKRSGSVHECDGANWLS